jgi:hypothetical protein
MSAEEVVMTHRSGPTVVTTLEEATDPAPSAVEGASSFDPAAAFLAGELLSRAEAQARGRGRGLVPSDLGAYEGWSAKDSLWFSFCISPIKNTLPFFCREPDGPEETDEPDGPEETDAPDR